jgi:hypothetical protein
MMSAVGAGAITNLGTTPFFTVKTRLQVFSKPPLIERRGRELSQQILLLKQRTAPKLTDGREIKKRGGRNRENREKRGGEREEIFIFCNRHNKCCY